MATDVMTGEGIGQALLTGRLAAEAILAAGALDAGAAAPALRARRCATTSSPTTACRRALGRVLAHEPRRPRRDRASSTTPATWGRRNFARWMFEDEPRALALTPSRWHRRVLGPARAPSPADRPGRLRAWRRTRSRVAHVVEQ